MLKNRFYRVCDSLEDCPERCTYYRKISSVCTSFYGISDHKPIILSCNKVLSDGFIRPAKVSKWPTHICKTKKSDLLSHNCFSILANDLNSHYDTLMADEMVVKFINIANNIGKEIKTFIPKQRLI